MIILYLQSRHAGETTFCIVYTLNDSLPLTYTDSFSLSKQRFTQDLKGY